MPIHEIGQKHRKGSLGSPYAVKDYYSVNTHLGTLADLKRFVTAAHEQGMHVILDWVANHTAWDNNLVHEHPEWYARDWKGDFCPTLGGTGPISSKYLDYFAKRPVELGESFRLTLEAWDYRVFVQSAAS